MSVKNADRFPVSFRLDPKLIKRMRDFCTAERWPPPPTQTEIVERGIELVLTKLEKRRAEV